MKTSTQLAAGRSAALIWIRTTGTNFLLSVMFAFFAYAAFLDWQRNGRIQALILVAEELLIVGLVITRRGSTAQSRSLWDWAVALIGTGAPLLLRPGLALPGLTPIGRGRQRILLDDPDYRAYAASVSCRFIPHRF
jgi:hypothetical protein